jgi:hypothetical protein
MSLPPRPPNDDQPQRKETASVDQQDVLDDTTLMTVVVALYAFFHVMSLYGLEPCTC